MNVIVDEGVVIMSEDEMEIIKLMREHENPGQALMTAILITLGNLRQFESSQKSSAENLQASS